MRRALAALLGALGVAAAAAGCGKPVLRVADPSLGDYYTDQEFRRLRKEQREEYCAELREQDSSYVAAIADLRDALTETGGRRDLALAAADSLARLADSLGVRVSGAPPAPAPRGSEAAGAWESYVVRSGDCLWRIAADGRGYGDGRDWRRIYEANRDAIRDPDLIHPGQEFRIPR